MIWSCEPGKVASSIISVPFHITAQSKAIGKALVIQYPAKISILLKLYTILSCYINLSAFHYDFVTEHSHAVEKKKLYYKKTH